MVPVRNDIVPPYGLLITDDDRGSRSVLAEIFPAPDFETVFASRGEEAIVIARSRTIDLAILDYHLPDMDGLKLFRTLSHELHALLPCILISGEVTAQVRNEAHQLGVFEVYEKPLNLEAIRSATELALTRRPPRVLPIHARIEQPRTWTRLAAWLRGDRNDDDLTSAEDQPN